MMLHRTDAPAPTALDARPRGVLVVDRQDDTRDILCSVLAERGIPTVAARAPADAPRLLARHRPAVVVVDLDDDASIDDARQALEQAGSSDAALVILGGPWSLRPDDPAGSSPAGPHHAGAPGSDDSFVAKPYHYGPLIRKIEGLLARVGHGLRSDLPTAA